jgi:hypothetical protein
MAGGIEACLVRIHGQRRLRQVQAPVAGHAFQLNLTALFEAQSRTLDELLGGARYEDLAGTSHAGNPRPDVDGDPANLALDGLGLAHVQPGARGEAELRGQVADRERTGDRVGRHVERGKQAIAGGVDLSSAEPLQPIADARVIPAQQALPGTIADP